MMMVNDAEDVSSDDGCTATQKEKARKRPSQPEKWRKSLAKKARHEAKRLPTLPTCKHKESSKFQCSKLSMQDIRRAHELYYKDKSLTSKKHFIVQHSRVASVKPNVLRENGDIQSSKRRDLLITHDLPRKRDGVVENIRVCQKAFLQILSEIKDRVRRVCRAYYELGQTPPEKRGGARKVELSVFRRNAVVNFIKKLKPLQSHYCRGQMKVRQYLNSSLSCNKLWKMFLAEHGLSPSALRGDEAQPVEMALNAEDGNPTEGTSPLPDETSPLGMQAEPPFILNKPVHLYAVKYECFRKIFNENFNIGFAAPYTDRCSTCMRLENQISHEKNEEPKKELKSNLSLHKKKANVFFDKLRQQTPEELLLSYDCQKNLVLPKVPDQEAYYRRQLYLYNFTICEGVSTADRSTSNTFSYTWTEEQYGKGSIHIASALYHRLCLLNFEGKSILKLFSDGCGGQNKNSTIMFMLQYWLLNKAPPNVEKIVIFFPIVGHSYIPPDRVFGNLEREFRSLSIIPNPQTYLDIIKKFTTLVRLGEDCDVIDWKEQSDKLLKTTTSWHFKFQKAKKITLTRGVTQKGVLVQGEPFYNFESGEPKYVTKRNKSLRTVNLSKVPQGVSIKSAKLADVLRLLQLHYGDKWSEDPSLEYYTKVFNDQRFETGASSSGTTDEVVGDNQDELVMELEIIGGEVVNIVGDPDPIVNNDEPEENMDFDFMESDEEEIL